MTLLLYPLPPKSMEQYKNFMIEHEDIYLLTLDNQEKAKYLNTKDRFIELHLKRKKISFWAIWSLKLAWISLGVLAGWLLYSNRRFLYVMIPTSIIFLVRFLLHINNAVSVFIDEASSWLDAYIQVFITLILIEQVPLMSALFYINQYLVLPILHIILLANFIFWNNKFINN